MKALVNFSSRSGSTECNIICNLVNIADDWYTFMYTHLSHAQYSKLKHLFGEIGMYYSRVEIKKIYGINQCNLEIIGKEVRIKNQSK